MWWCNANPLAEEMFHKNFHVARLIFTSFRGRRVDKSLISDYSTACHLSRLSFITFDLNSRHLIPLIAWLESERSSTAKSTIHKAAVCPFEPGPLQRNVSLTRYHDLESTRKIAIAPGQTRNCR